MTRQQSAILSALWCCFLCASWVIGVDGFNPVAMASTVAAGGGSAAASATSPSPEMATKPMPVSRVAVIGATGRTGQYVVQELLNRPGIQTIVAVVRSRSKAQQVFGNMPVNVDFVECDLTSEDSIRRALAGAEAAIWCATGFSSESTVVDRVKNLVGLATKQSIDLVGLPIVAQTISESYARSMAGRGSASSTSTTPVPPKVIMCSSAGVTRPTWSPQQRRMMPGAADIPIVRLNPFGILDIKRQSEDLLRKVGVPYCIVRPAGLNDKWPIGSRPILSQGDVAVGRIHRQDVAELLVDLLCEPAASGVTMEVVGVAGYPKGSTAQLSTTLERLLPDGDGQVPMEAVAATYAVMQQLLPGETQDAAALAMGQTYEQLDQGETGRLGERGSEDVGSAGLNPTSASSSSSIGGGGGAGTEPRIYGVWKQAE